MQRAKEWLNCEKYGESRHYGHLTRLAERNSSFDLCFLFLALTAAGRANEKDQAASGSLHEKPKRDESRLRVFRCSEASRDEIKAAWI